LRFTRSALWAVWVCTNQSHVFFSLTGCLFLGPRKNDLTNYWALGPFVRPFTSLVDPGDIYPPHCSSADKVSQVGSMMLLREISELSLEPAIEGRFDASIFVFPSGVAKKYVDAFSERQTLKKNRWRCPLHKGGRSARGAGRSATWCEARWYSLRRGGLSAAWGRTVRGLARS
jgi:hypothetical protein